MKLSVIIVSHNSQRTIERCLISVYKSLENVSDYEIIVVDNGSTDKTKEILSKFHIKLVEINENKGAAFARNLGVFNSFGDILVFIDSDVEVKSDFKELVNFFEQNFDVDVIQGVYDIHLPLKNFSSNFRNIYKAYKFSKLNNYINSINSFCFAIKKDVFDKVGGFNPHFEGVEDVEFGMRVFEKGFKIFLNKNLIVLHLKEYSLKKLVKTDFRKIYCKFLLSLKKRNISNLSFSLNKFSDNRLEFLNPLIGWLSVVSLVFVGYSIKFIFLFFFFVFLFVLVNYRFISFIYNNLGFIFAIKSIVFYLFEMTVLLFALFFAVSKFITEKMSFLINNIVEKSRWIYKMFFSNILPEQFTFFITSRCNFKCQHCFYWKEINSKADFKIDEFNKVVKSFGRFSFLSITGGEPFLRDDIVDIVIGFVKFNGVKRISIPTNGYETYRIYKAVDEIMPQIPENVKLIVKFSIDGFKQTHDKIRQVSGSFDRVIETINRISVLKNKYKNLKIGVITTINSVNEKEIDLLYKYIDENLKVDVVTINYIRGDVKNLEFKNVDFDVYKKTFMNIINNNREKQVNNFFNIYKKRVISVIEEIVEKNIYPLKCRAARVSCVIDSDLNVYSCEGGMFFMGNIREFDYDFKKLWFSKKADLVRNKIDSKECVCMNECNIQNNIFFNFNNSTLLCFDLIKTFTLSYSNLKNKVFVGERV